MAKNYGIIGSMSLECRSKGSRVDIRQRLLNRYEIERSAFLNCIHACDELWVHQNTPEKIRAV